MKQKLGIYFKQIGIPIIIGSTIILILYTWIDIKDLNRGDVVSGFLIGFFSIVILMHRLNNTDLPDNKLNRIYRYYFPKRKRDSNDKDLTIYIDNKSHVIYYSKLKSVWGIIGIVLLGSGVIYIGMEKKTYLFSLIALIFSIYQIQLFIKHLLNKQPQIVLNDKGIATKKIGFQKWGSIKIIDFKDDIETEGQRSINLEIYLSDKEKWKRPDDSIHINNLNTNQEMLELLIRIHNEYGIQNNT